jgi:multidrug efflux pump subunit AcrB
MIRKFVQFWIDNAKVTIVLMLVTVIGGIWAYILIPKQYNPDIPVPAFSIIVPAPWYSAKEVQHLVLEPLEDRVSEIKKIDHIYWVANDNFAVLMVRFEVWYDKEKATTLLYNKIFENLWKKPIWVKDPIIYKMDPDDFPIYTFAIVDTNSWANFTGDEIKLRKIWIDVANRLKFIDWTSVFYLAGWYPDNINVILDLKKLEWKNIDIMQVYQAIKKNNLVFPWWELKLNKVEGTITIDGSLNDIEKLRKLIVWYYNGKPVYLQEVAKIFKWVPEINYYTYVSGISWKNLEVDHPAVFIGIAKRKQTNAVFLVRKIKAELKKIEKTLPSWYKFVEIDDEWKVAEDATNALLLNLVESIIIVFFVLLVYLGLKDAINNAFAIPLTLLMAFIIAFVLRDNINRIVLFALVLALWMLVDNSTVVIENIARHLRERKENETVKDAILKAVDEVWIWVVLATITRVLSLVAMFFVTWMMGEYMWGVPKYVIISLVVSLLIAFSINPFIAYLSYKDNPPKPLKNDEWPREWKISRIYAKFLSKFLWDSRRVRINRKLFKIGFWISLFGIIIIPPAIWIFKMWMLPKDNKNQIYIWVDWSNNWSVKKSKEVADYINHLLQMLNHRKCNVDQFNKIASSVWWKDKLTKDFCIIDNVSYAIWTSPVIDFSNAFRWVAFRKQPNQITSRVNFIDKSKRDLSSIDFVLKFRPLFEKIVWAKYPDAKIRVLEDPPGPPLRASFMLRVQWERDVEYKDLESLALRIKDKIKPILKKDDVVDVYTTIDTEKVKYKIQIDHQLLESYWLTTQQVAYTIYNIFKWMNVSLIHDPHTRDPINIYLTVDPNQKYNPNIFNQISFTNSKWQKIYLKQFAKVVKVDQDHKVYTEDRYQSVYIYWEMWDNVVTYPAMHITKLLISDKFWDWKFKVVSWTPYKVIIRNVNTWKEYRISWWWERELSLDTFRDLWIAMIIALLAIYFLMVAQFKSFKIAGVIMLTFLLWLFGIMPWFSFIYETIHFIFTAPSMIWVIALAWIVVWNAIILIDYAHKLLDQWVDKKTALIRAWQVRMRAIIITSMTTVLWSTTILWDPVWWGLGWSIVWWLTASAILTLVVIPIFLYDIVECKDNYCSIK